MRRTWQCSQPRDLRVSSQRETKNYLRTVSEKWAFTLMVSVRGDHSGCCAQDFEGFTEGCHTGANLLSSPIGTLPGPCLCRHPRDTGRRTSGTRARWGIDISTAVGGGDGFGRGFEHGGSEGKPTRMRETTQESERGVNKMLQEM